MTEAVPPAVPPSGARRIRWYWEDFPVGEERRFGATTVTREAVLAFASQFDPQPFHLDDEAARASLFGALSASGWHTCAMAMRMMCDAYLLDSSSLGSPGIDQLRWLKPVFPGDTLSVRLTVLETRPMASRPKVGLVLSRWEVLNQADEPVLSMQGWAMFGRREAAVAGAPAVATTAAAAATTSVASESTAAAAGTTSGTTGGK